MRPSYAESLPGSLTATAVVCFVLSLIGNSLGQGKGTTANIQAIFIGRCWEYQTIVNLEPFKHEKKNCTQLWDLFHKAFAYKRPCGVPKEAFQEFAEEAYHPGPNGKQMFWTRVYPFVRDFTAVSDEYYPLESTLTGYMTDSLRFCGQEGYPGMNSDVCPRWSECGDDQSTSDGAFWKMVSTTFAANAQGQVYGMFNGSHGKGDYNISIFSQHELPNLTPQRVPKFNIFVIHDLGKPEREHCGTGTFIELEAKIRRQGIEVECFNDPPHIRHFQCLANEDLHACAFANPHPTSKAHRRSAPYLNFVLLIIILYNV